MAEKISENYFTIGEFAGLFWCFQTNVILLRTQ